MSEVKSAEKQETQETGIPAQKGEDGSVFFDIGNKKRVTIRKFKGKQYVDIREYYEKDGKLLPGTKGVSLTIEQWDNLASLVEKVESTLCETA